MYIGNDRGLLVFDGIHWDLVKLPNNLGVRALYISKDGRIYVGSFEEFGYFEMDDEKKIIKRKSFELRPMTSEDAILTMEMLDHTFLVYLDANTDNVCVVYKRKDGNYGLIEPIY